MIELSKKGAETTIDLSKGGTSISGPIIANLNWTQHSGGFFKGLLGGGVDLDLGCFFELTDGSKSVIDALQFSGGQGGGRTIVSRQGCFTRKPWIWHTGDDLTGASSEGEFIHVNPEGISDIKRIDFYAYIYEGVAKWADSDAVIKLTVPGHEEIVIRMAEINSKQKFAVLCNLEFTASGIKVVNANSFHDGHGEADRYHGWGMKWRAGSK